MLRLSVEKMAETIVFGNDQVYRIKRLMEIEWLVHGFGTRTATNWTKDTMYLKQVHSSKVVTVEEKWWNGPESGDAMVTNKPGLVLGIRTADCFPVLLVDPVSKSIGAVHAGWRGCADNITGKTVERMVARYAADADNFIAVVGPGISKESYEVSADVAKQFAKWFPELAEVAEPVTLDLAETIRKQLIQAGVKARNVINLRMCTKKDKDSFYSYRRDGEAAGRMISAIGIMNKHQMRGPMYRMLDQTHISLD